MTIAHCLHAGAGALGSWRLAPELGQPGWGGAPGAQLLPSDRSVPAPRRAAANRLSQLIGSSRLGGTILLIAQRTVCVRAGRIAHLGRSDVDIDLGNVLGSGASNQWESPAYLLLIGQISLALTVDPCSFYPSLLGFHACLLITAGPRWTSLSQGSPMNSAPLQCSNAAHCGKLGLF